MELVYFQIIDRQAGIHPGQRESKHTIGRWLDKALFLTTSDVCCNETTGCISLKFMTTLLIFIFKSTNQVFPQVVSRLATSFSSIYFTDHCHYRGTLGLKVYVFPWNWQSELVFSTTRLLSGLFNWSISHMFRQPTKVAPIIHFYILIALTERDDWFLNSKQQISDQLGTWTQPASCKVRI